MLFGPYIKNRSRNHWTSVFMNTAFLSVWNKHGRCHMAPRTGPKRAKWSCIDFLSRMCSSNAWLFFNQNSTLSWKQKFWFGAVRGVFSQLLYPRGIGRRSAGIRRPGARWQMGSSNLTSEFVRFGPASVLLWISLHRRFIYEVRHIFTCVVNSSPNNGSNNQLRFRKVCIGCSPRLTEYVHVSSDDGIL